VKLFKGRATAAGASSPYSLYDQGLGGFSNVKLFDQKDSIGFIKLFGLQQRLENQI
jgi:argininosuccinate synthase